MIRAGGMSPGVFNELLGPAAGDKRKRQEDSGLGRECVLEKVEGGVLLWHGLEEVLRVSSLLLGRLCLWWKQPALGCFDIFHRAGRTGESEACFTACVRAAPG